MTTAPFRFQNIEEEDEKPTYTQPIKLEDLPYTPAEYGSMLEEHNTTKKKVIREIDIDGLGGGRLAITRKSPYLNEGRGYHTVFYPDEKNLAFNQQEVKKAETLFTFANAPALLAPILAPFMVKSQPVTRIRADGTKHNITKGGQTIFQQKKSNQKTLKRLKNEQRIEDVTGFGDKSILADTDVFNMSNSRIREIIRIAKRNKISYEKAEAYVNLKEQGIVPQQSINPGTNKGLIEGNLPLNVIHARLMKGAKDKGAGDLEMNINYFDPEEVEPGDVPTFDLSTMIDPIRGKEPRNILNILNQNGMRGGRLDIFEYRAKGKNRQAVEYYVSPYSKMIKFDPRRNFIVASMNRKFGGQQETLGLGEKRSFQAHHVVPIKASLPAFHGIVKESPKYNYYMKLYHDSLLALGNQLENIVPAIGAVDRDYDAPHHLVHQMIEAVMGKAGETFWDDTVLESLVVRNKDGQIIRTRNDEMRERLILKQINLFKRAEDIIKIGMQEYSLYASNEIVPPEVIVDYFIGKLPTDLKYTPELIKRLVRDAMEDMTDTYVPSIVAGTVSADTLRIVQDIASRPGNWWSQLNTAEKKAKLPELTESYRGAGDGYTFEQLMELIDAGMLPEKMIQKLLSAEKPDFDGFINELFKE